MVEVEVPESAGPEIVVNYAGDLVMYAPADGVVEVEDHHLDEFLGAVEGSRRHIVEAAPPKSAKSSAKPAQKE